MNRDRLSASLAEYEWSATVRAFLAAPRDPIYLARLRWLDAVHREATGHPPAATPAPDHCPFCGAGLMPAPPEGEQTCS